MMDYTKLIERLNTVPVGHAGLLTQASNAIEALQARCGKAFEEGRDFQAQVESQLRRERDAALAKLEALEKQAPCLWMNEIGQLSATRGWAERTWHGQKLIPLYASPVPAKTLSDPEIEVIVNSIANGNGDIEYPNRFVFVRAIEAKLKGGA